MITRRQMLFATSALAGLGLLSPALRRVAQAQAAPVPLDPAIVPKFVRPLPNPLDPSFVFTKNMAANQYQISITETEQDLLGVPGLPPTKVWGYANLADPNQPASYPGRTFVVQRDIAEQVQWSNDLGTAATPLPHLLPIDSTIHWADPLNRGPVPGGKLAPVPTVTHLHGGDTESTSDGLPDDWFTPGEAILGPRFVKSLYDYANTQEATTLWYHDHALGITRLNVYAGLAGFYIIRDAVDTGRADNPLGLPAFPYEVPIVIQDRLFDTAGQLFYPSTDPLNPLAPDPTVLPEFFGNVILCNGVAWPVLDVEPRKYRLRLLNGSDSRFYSLRIAGGPPLVQIGTDEGLLFAPVPLTSLDLGPGERADVIVDFAGFAGQTLVLRNNAKVPFPKGAAVDPQNEGRIMAFRVGAAVTVPEAPLAAQLRAAPITPADLGAPVRTRQLILFEGIDGRNRLQPMLGTVADGTLLWNDPITENPGIGDTEVWEIYNATADAHPIHLHLVAFQILNRQGFTATILPKTQAPMHPEVQGGILANIALKGAAKPPAANEAGWKDTVQTFPGEVTRIVAKFDRPGLYVWHCHILSHEDHEMMRPIFVGPLPPPAMP